MLLLLVDGRAECRTCCAGQRETEEKCSYGSLLCWPSFQCCRRRRRRCHAEILGLPTVMLSVADIVEPFWSRYYNLYYTTAVHPHISSGLAHLMVSCCTCCGAAASALLLLPLHCRCCCRCYSRSSRSCYCCSRCS